MIVKDYGEFEIIGRTRDDAAGEAFDKVEVRGPGISRWAWIDKAAKEGNPHAIQFPGKVEGAPLRFQSVD